MTAVIETVLLVVGMGMLKECSAALEVVARDCWKGFKENARSSTRTSAALKEMGFSSYSLNMCSRSLNMCARFNERI